MILSKIVIEPADVPENATLKLTYKDPETGEEKETDGLCGYCVIGSSDMDFYITTQGNPVPFLGFVVEQFEDPTSPISQLLFSALGAAIQGANMRSLTDIYSGMLAIMETIADRQNELKAEEEKGA